MSKHNQTVTYIDCSNNTLDTEQAKRAPKRGELVTFLEHGGTWQVQEVTRANGDGTVVRVDRRS